MPVCPSHPCPFQSQPLKDQTYLHVDDCLVVCLGRRLLVRIEAQVYLLAPCLNLRDPLARLLVGAYSPVPRSPISPLDQRKCKAAVSIATFNTFVDNSLCEMMEMQDHQKVIAARTYHWKREIKQ